MNQVLGQSDLIYSVSYPTESRYKTSESFEVRQPFDVLQNTPADDHRVNTKSLKSNKQIENQRVFLS